MRTRKLLFVAFVGTLVLVGATAFVLGKRSSQPQEPLAQSQEEYPLLAKRIFLDNPSDTRVNFSPLRTSINKYFNDNNLKGSFYFEYLPTGTSIRVNGNEEFRAASLIKIPVAMELYKAAELGQVDLDKKVALKAEWLNSDYGELYKKGAGYEISLRDAAKVMLTDSDNTALRMILDATSILSLENRALGALDIEFSQVNDDGALNIGARSYSSFLKCLYFACYTNKEHSQEILGYLSESDFNTRIMAGIDNKDIKVAHKIGVFNTKVQSDCGIVYVPEKNYVICVILEGNDTPETDKHIAELSRQVYTYINNN